MMESPQTQSETSWWSGNLQTMAIFLLSVNCCAVRCRKVWIFCSGGAILRGLRRCSYTTIWAGLTSRASWKAHRALRFRDSGATPTGSLRAIVITLPIRQTVAAAPPIVADSRALPSPSALKPSRCGCRILARSLRIRSTPTAVASSSVVMLKPT